MTPKPYTHEGLAGEDLQKRDEMVQLSTPLIFETFFS